MNGKNYRKFFLTLWVKLSIVRSPKISKRLLNFNSGGYQAAKQKRQELLGKPSKVEHESSNIIEPVGEVKTENAIESKMVNTTDESLIDTVPSKLDISHRKRSVSIDESFSCLSAKKIALKQNLDDLPVFVPVRPSHPLNLKPINSFTWSLLQT